MRFRLIAAGLVLLAASGLAGCSAPGSLTRTPNPLIVPSSDFEAAWKASLTVLDDYFEIASENRLARKIVTQPKMGATILEPWYGDSVGFNQRLESTIQSIRRIAIVQIDPAPGGGYAIKVEVNKEMEDLPKPERQMGGRAVFSFDQQVNRTREVVGPVPLPLGWISRGRDTQLEQVILDRIRRALFL